MRADSRVSCSRTQYREKESPSDEALTKLIRALKAPKREAEMLRYLADHQDVSIGLAEHALDDQTVTPQELLMAASVVHRGPARRDYKTVIERIRSVLGDEDRG